MALKELYVLPFAMQVRVFDENSEANLFDITINGDRAEVQVVQGEWTDEIEAMFRSKIALIGMEKYRVRTTG